MHNTYRTICIMRNSYIQSSTLYCWKPVLQHYGFLVLDLDVDRSYFRLVLKAHVFFIWPSVMLPLIR